MRHGTCDVGVESWVLGVVGRWPQGEVRQGQAGPSGSAVVQRSRVCSGQHAQSARALLAPEKGLNWAVVKQLWPSG